MSGNTQPAYRPDIDGLRAIAVLAVVAYHSSARLVPGGFAGVDIFFVISGFLISSIIFKNLERGAFSFADFYARRIRRIFPALSVVLVAVWALGWFSLLPDAYRQLGRHIAAGAGFVSNIAFWREAGYFDKVAEQKPLLHLWSLGVEEQFYLIWPGLMFLCWSAGANLLAAVLAVAAASFLMNVFAVRGHPAAVFYLPMTRLWELSLGSVLAYASVSTAVDGGGAISRVLALYRSRGARVRDAESIAGSLLVVATLVEVNRLRAFPGWWALLPTVGTFLIISAGMPAWINRRVLSRRALVFVGLISYPLYLWHWPLFAYLRIMSVGDPPRAWLAGAVAAAFVLAWATYRFIESPIRVASAIRPGRLAVGLASALVVVALAGVWTVKIGGVPERFAGVLRPVTGFKYNYGPDYREGRCFLMPNQSDEAFGADCLDPAASPRTPLLFLWGDSHGAHLYPGLRRLQQARPFRVAQYTASGCPPMIGAATPLRPHCPEINQSVLARIEHVQPQIVLLSAWWVSYDDLTPLGQTVAALRKTGVGRIVLLGPVPTWAHPLPEVLVAAFERDPRHRVPSRTSFGLLPAADLTDRQLREIAARLGIVYVSVLDILCDAHGCLTRIGNRDDDFTAWDASHLTADGSAFVIRAAERRLFDTPLAAATSRN